ncbi:MAG: LamG domain-containing protein [Planctomycetota bacterium]
MRDAVRDGMRGVLLLAALAALCVGCGKPTTGLRRREKGLVGHWKFDREGGSTARDSAGLGNDGEIIGATRVAGKEGRALSFTSPRSRVEIPSSEDLKLGRAITIEAWIRPQDLSEGPRVVLSKNDEYALRIDGPDEGNKLSLFVHVGAPAVSWEPRASSQERPKLNRWQHVVAVWTGSSLRLYVDGKLVGQRRRVGRPNPTPYPIVIGNWEYPSCHGMRFGGAIDEVKIYNYARTPESPTAP